MPPEVFSIKIGGEAGQGIKSAGLLLAKLAVRTGLNVYDYIEYPSLIRGGHNVMQINISLEPVTGAYQKCDLLLALNQDTITKHANELTKEAGLIFDADKRHNLNQVGKNVRLYPVPLANLANKTGGGELLRNTVALGAAVGLLGGNIKKMADLIDESFGHKGGAIQESNIKAFELGYKYAKENFSLHPKPVLYTTKTTTSLLPQILVNGNEGAALGAISGGLDFAAIYPMSPISGILAVLAANEQEYGYIYKQPEDEIAAINMALGAAFGGARALTATSGGGFCLMTESYGLAGMTETPIVIIDGMRGGPATGLPTWSEQGDLRMALHSHQGDFPRIVLAPGDAKEAFELTMRAFNLAEIYQTPVVVLLDKNICDNDQNFTQFDTSDYQINRGKIVGTVDPDYKRYRFESDGISPRAFAGSGNFFVANSDEHDEYGICTEEIATRSLQVGKRMQKLATCAQNHMQPPKLYGPKNADLTLVSWGSNKGPILQALKNFSNVNYLHTTWLNPLPARELAQNLKQAKQIVNIECNYSAQFGGLIKERVGIEITDNLLKYDGRPFFVEEITEKIRATLEGGAK